MQDATKGWLLTWGLATALTTFGAAITWGIGPAMMAAGASMLVVVHAVDHE